LGGRTLSLVPSRSPVSFEFHICKTEQNECANQSTIIGKELAGLGEEDEDGEDGEKPVFSCYCLISILK
jgi:hypothetical protein